MIALKQRWLWVDENLAVRRTVGCVVGLLGPAQFETRFLFNWGLFSGFLCFTDTSQKKNLTSIRNCHLLNVGLLSVWILLYISFTQTLFGFVVAYIHPLLPDILTRVWGRSKRETDGHLFLPSIPWHYYSSYDIIVFASFSAVVHYGSLHVRVWVCVGGCVYAFRKVCLCCFPHVISV